VALSAQGAERIDAGAHGLPEEVGESPLPRQLAAAEFSSPPSDMEQPQYAAGEEDAALPLSSPDASPLESDEEPETSSPPSPTLEDDSKTKLVARWLLQRSTSRARASSGTDLVPKSRGSLSPLRRSTGESEPANEAPEEEERGMGLALDVLSRNAGAESRGGGRAQPDPDADAEVSFGSLTAEVVQNDASNGGEEDDGGADLQEWASELPSLLRSELRTAVPIPVSLAEEEANPGVTAPAEDIARPRRKHGTRSFEFTLSDEALFSDDNVF